MWIVPLSNSEAVGYPFLIAMKTEKIFYRRDFLNKDFYNSDASIFSNIYFEVSEDNKLKWENISLKIRDCNNTINLELSVEDEGVFENSLFKIDTMISHLKDLKVGLISARIYKELKETVNKNGEDSSN